MNNLINKKFKKSLIIGALATSLAISPVGSYLNTDLNTTIEAKKKTKKAKKTKKVKIYVKRLKGNKKTKTLKSGKQYKDKFSIKLKNGKKKIGKKKFTVILREKDKVLKVTPKKGIKNYSKILGTKKSVIKKGKKANGFKIKYFVDPNVKLKLRQNITVLCTYILNGKKHVKKKKITNIRFVLGKDYKKKVTQTSNVNKTNTPLTQEQINTKFEQETGEKLNIVETPAPMPTIVPGGEIDKKDIKEPENPNEDVTFYDDNGKAITDPSYTPEPLPIVDNSKEEKVVVNDDKYYLDNGNVITINHNYDAFNEAQNKLVTQDYNSGIILNSIDPLVSKLYFSKDSGLNESGAYLEYLRLGATDKNGNDISNNITVYDYDLRNNISENSDNNVIVKVTDNSGKEYLQYYNIAIRNNEFLDNMQTGEITVSENDSEMVFYEVYQLSLDPVVYAETDKMKMNKLNELSNDKNLILK